jgi:hypothetical protein
VLRGSEKDPEGGDRKGGGNGRGGRLANSEMPVSNRNGRLSMPRWVVLPAAGTMDWARSCRQLEVLEIWDRHTLEVMARTTCILRADLLIPAFCVPVCGGECIHIKLVLL